MWRIANKTGFCPLKELQGIQVYSQIYFKPSWVTVVCDSAFWVIRHISYCLYSISPSVYFLWCDVDNVYFWKSSQSGGKKANLMNHEWLSAIIGVEIWRDGLIEFCIRRMTWQFDEMNVRVGGDDHWACFSKIRAYSRVCVCQQGRRHGRVSASCRGPVSEQ